MHFWQGIHQTELMSSVHNVSVLMMLVCLTTGDHLAKVMSAGFLHCIVTDFFFGISKYLGGDC